MLSLAEATIGQELLIKTKKWKSSTEFKMLQYKMCHARKDTEDFDARLLFKPLRQFNAETLEEA